MGKTGPGQGEPAAPARRATARSSPRSRSTRVTGEVRVRRMLGVFDVGRVLNAQDRAPARSIGGMVWGHRLCAERGRRSSTPAPAAFVNPDFGEYHVAVNADVPQIEVHFIEEIDDHANPVGAKGVGELGISGAGAAVANAIYNACGVRVRDFPITLDKLLAGLPPSSDGRERRRPRRRARVEGRADGARHRGLDLGLGPAPARQPHAGPRRRPVRGIGVGRLRRERHPRDRRRGDRRARRSR